MQVARYTLAAALFAEIALLPLTTPRSATVSELREQLAAGDVTAVFFDERVGPAASAYVAPTIRYSEEGTPRPAVTWQTGPLQTWTARRDGPAVDWSPPATDMPGMSPDRSPDMSSDMSSDWSRMTEDSTGLETQLGSAVRQAGFAEPSFDRPPLESFASWLRLAWWVVVAVVVFGTQPRCATRWATFWRTLMPLNAGAWSTVLREAPWNSSAAAEPAPLAHSRQDPDPRPTGGPAFCWLVLSSILVGAAWPFVIGGLQAGLDRLLG